LPFFNALFKKIVLGRKSVGGYVTSLHPEPTPMLAVNIYFASVAHSR